MKGDGDLSKKALDLVTKPLKIKIMLFVAGAVGALLLIIILIAAATSLFKPIMDVFDGAEENDSKLNDKLSKEEEKFKEKVNKVYEDIKKDTGVEIDRAVLVSTVTYEGNYSDIYESYNIDDAVEDIFVEEKGWGEVALESIKSWLNENLFGKTPERAQLKRYRLSTVYLKALGYAQLNDSQTKLDLEGYEEYIANGVIAHLYPDLVSDSDKEASQKRIAREIMELADMYYAYFGDDKGQGVCSSGLNCEYQVDGQTINNLKVRLLQCVDMNRGEPVPGEQLVDFEKYILGVVYAEVGAESSIETLKTQAVAARSYALTRGKIMGGTYNVGLTEENGQWILSLRNCTEDQVYCDPDLGCSNTTDPRNSGNDTTVFSGAETKPYFYKGPLAEDAPIRAAVTETAGKVLVDENDDIVYTDYVNTDQMMWASEAAKGKDYTEILINHYPGSKGIDEGNCSSSKGGSCSTIATGPFTNWKQCDPQWGSLSLGSNTICNIGCLATSVAMQIAASGIETGIQDFNPGTFVQKGEATGVFVGGNMHQGRVSNAVPGFYQAEYIDNICGLSQKQKIDKVKEMLNQGCYVVMEVKGARVCSGSYGQHWVAVHDADDNGIYMWDPASDSVEVFSKYGNVGAALSCYKTSSGG